MNNDFKEKKIKEFNKLVGADSTSFQDLESFISTLIDETRKETIGACIEVVDQVKKRTPMQRAKSEFTWWDCCNCINAEFRDKLNNQEDFTTDERGKEQNEQD